MVSPLAPVSTLRLLQNTSLFCSVPSSSSQLLHQLPCAEYTAAPYLALSNSAARVSQFRKFSSVYTSAQVCERRNGLHREVDFGEQLHLKDEEESDSELVLQKQLRCVYWCVQEKKRKASSQGQARMYVAKDDSAAAAFNQGRSMQGLQEVPLGQRATSTSGRHSVVTARYAAATVLCSSSLFAFPSSCFPSSAQVIPT